MLGLLILACVSSLDAVKMKTRTQRFYRAMEEQIRNKSWDSIGDCENPAYITDQQAREIARAIVARNVDKLCLDNPENPRVTENRIDLAEYDGRAGFGVVATWSLCVGNKRFNFEKFVPYSILE